MNRTMIFMAVIALFCAGISAYGPIVIPGTQGWHGTGVNVEAGQQLVIEAYGLVCISLNCQASNMVDPDGNCPGLPEPTDCYVESSGSNCLAPGLPNGLIGRIDSGDQFVVGSHLVMVSDIDGELQLAFNDSYYDDNTGSYDVYVTVLRGVPALGSYAIATLALIFVVSGIYMIRRRKSAA